jgi:hypothetical protein
MLSLYFNCRLTKARLTPDSADAGYFYPVVYPKDSVQNHDQYKILIQTLESYSSLSFIVAVLNIEIDVINADQKSELEFLVQNTISAQKKILQFTRPSTVESWKADAGRLSELVGENNPVLVVMNHDHPFVDYTPAPFVDAIDKVFDATGDNFGKAFYYSHAPEVMSWAINGRGLIKFSREGDLYRSVPVNDWIDSICVFTPATLESIWSKLRFTEEYIGRLDWVGATYRNLGLTTYVSPREYFKHFDGYSHISGMRLMTDISVAEKFEINPPPKELDAAVDFYYQRWIDAYLLVIRDNLKLTRSFNKSMGLKFRKILEEALRLMRASYLEEDARLGLLDKEMLEVVYGGLRNKVYFNANYLFIQIYADILLLRLSIIGVIKSKLYLLYQKYSTVLKNIFHL